MATLIDTVLPTEEYIESVLKEHALEGRSEPEFVEGYLNGLEQRLIANVLAYRSFGPWWPALKTLLLERGVLSIGQVVDSDVAAIYSMSRPALTLIAAHLYADDIIDTGNMFSADHLLSVMPSADDTEPYLYVSYDESVEKFKLG
ncbi:olxA [Atlantibacter hermannii]|uniref:olxA n=1 Tax=Atlantibacter hermannii TaxID=565 RepID=UPI00289C7138|nr:olxA [Atlantibacter hermannii]